jgi:hypothetical protein
LEKFVLCGRGAVFAVATTKSSAPLLIDNKMWKHLHVHFAGWCDWEPAHSKDAVVNLSIYQMEVVQKSTQHAGNLFIYNQMTFHNFFCRFPSRKIILFLENVSLTRFRNKEQFFDGVGGKK